MWQRVKKYTSFRFFFLLKNRKFLKNSQYSKIKRLSETKNCDDLISYLILIFACCVYVKLIKKSRFLCSWLIWQNSLWKSVLRKFGLTIPIIAKPFVKFKNIICKEIDLIEASQLSSVNKISFTKYGVTTRFYIWMKNRKQSNKTYRKPDNWSKNM